MTECAGVSSGGHLLSPPPCDPRLGLPLPHLQCWPSVGVTVGVWACRGPGGQLRAMAAAHTVPLPTSTEPAMGGGAITPPPMGFSVIVGGGALKDTKRGAPGLSAQDAAPSTWGAVMSNPGLGPGHPCTPHTPYLQGQLQAQVFCVVAEHGPGGTEEDVMYCAVLVLDVTLWGPRGS